VINEAFARRYFEGRNPIGMRITPDSEDELPECRVVGVAKNARTYALRGDVRPRFYIPAHWKLSSMQSPTFIVRTSSDAAPVLVAVRKTIQRIDPTLPILSSVTMAEQLAPETAQDRVTAQLAIAFGAGALALAAIGLYGVLSYAIARRTGEIAIRIALGAQSNGVIALILRETLWLIAAGLVLGGGLAWATSRLVVSRLYGVAPQDPATIAAAAALLLLVALTAAWLPARRASRLDPIAALRL
jgi:ABC-type antimicrobial peptide transport system permease subunit